jgi:hypothetical protein
VTIKNKSMCMKNLLLIIIIGSLFACSTQKPAPSAQKKDDIFLTRKYIGNFVDYRHTGPEIIGGTDLIWITTTVVSSFGKISAYGRTCDFSPGERVYLKTTYPGPGNVGLFGYIIENDSLVCYRVSEYQYNNKSFVRSWSQ